MSNNRSTNDRFVMLNDWITTVFTVLLGFYLIYWLLDYSLWISLILTVLLACVGYLRIRLKSLELKVESLSRSEESQK